MAKHVEFPLANPDLELRGGPGSVLLALLRVLLSVIFFLFCPKIGEWGGGGGQIDNTGLSFQVPYFWLIKSW